MIIVGENIMNKPKPDDRSDNAERIRKAIDATKQNMEAAEEMIAETSDESTKRDLSAKNERRKAALPDMEWEMREEAAHKNWQTHDE